MSAKRLALAWALSVIAVVLFVGMCVMTALGIWTGDDRWAQSAVMAFIFSIPFAGLAAAVWSA